MSLMSAFDSSISFICSLILSYSSPDDCCRKFAFLCTFLTIFATLSITPLQLFASSAISCLPFASIRVVKSAVPSAIAFIELDTERIELNTFVENK